MSFLVSPHTHPESPLSGSTVEAMIKQAVKLGRTHFAYTDPAYMASLLRGYNYIKKQKLDLKYIPGLEVLFKDDHCDIIAGTQAAKARYFKITLYAKTQEAFYVLSRLSSRSDRPTTLSYGQEFPLWGWADLEECGRSDIVAVSGDLHDMVSKHLLTKTPKLAEAVLLKLKGIFGSNNLYLSIVGCQTTHSWISLTQIKYVDGSEDVFLSNDKIHTNAAARVGAKEVVDKPNKHIKVLSGIKNGVLYQIHKDVKSAHLKEGFIALPGGDQQLTANKLMSALANRHQIPLLYSDYAYYAEPDDKAVQDVRLSQDDIREHTKRHMQSSDEALQYLTQTMGMGQEQALAILNNNNKWATQFNDFKFTFSYKIPKPDSDESALSQCLKIIKENGRLPDSQVYRDRLKMEIEVLARNGVVDLTPYLLPIRDVLNFYKENGQITGPSRGSAAGSLLLYLMGITQVDPIKYGLSFERFLSLARINKGDFADIDVDLQNRELLVGEDGKSGYLYGRWGNKAAQISTRILLRLKSAIKDVNRYVNDGVVDPAIDRLSKSLPVPPQGVSDADYVFGFEDDDGNHHPGLIEVNKDLKDYADSRPKEWTIVQKCLGISRQNSRHASAFVISSEPIEDIVPTFMGNVTQYEAKAIESAKLIKYDFLVVNQLADIQVCIDYINKKNNTPNLGTGNLLHKDRVVNVWDLPQDPDVFKSVWGGDTETLFQIHTQSMVPYVKDILPQSIEDISTILALVRPGPLDYIDPTTGRNMAQEYVERRFGRSEADMPELLALLPETYGVQVFQEQTSKVAKEIGRMDPTDAEELRRLFSKKLKTAAMAMKPKFMRGAVETVGQEKAEIIWAQMETSSRYNFNMSHSTSYAMITHTCMFLKHHYPLEWWAAVLSNADEQEFSNKLFKYVKTMVAPPDINESQDTMTIDYDRQKIRSKLTVLRGLGEKVAQPIVAGRPYKSIKDFVSRKIAGPSLTKKLIHVGVMDSLFPASHSLIDKMQAYEDSVLEIAHEKKIEEGKKIKTLSKGSVDVEYLSMHPLEDFRRKKAILPTLPLDLTPLFVRHSGFVNEGTASSPRYSFNNGNPVPLLTGDQIKYVEAEGNGNNDFYFCSVGHIIKADEFDFAKKSKKALKMIIDCDGHTAERVLWPDYNTGKLHYPNDLKKGSIVLFFMKRQVLKQNTNILSMTVLKSLTGSDT